MNHVKVSQVLATSINSFGDKLVAFSGTDGKFYWVSMQEGWHKDIKPGNVVSNCDEVKPNEHGIINLSFIHN